MVTVSGGVMFAAVMPPGIACAGWLLARVLAAALGAPRPPFPYPCWCGSGAGFMLGAAGQHDWLAVLIAGANTAAAFACWWLSRRRRRRAPKEAGAKSRARLATLVRKSRQAARPRPVRRPALEGAR